MEAHLLETVPRKEEEGGGGGARAERKGVVATGGPVQENHLDLRLGISLNGFVRGRGGGTTTGGPSGRSKGADGHVLAGAATAGSFCVGGVVAPSQQPARVCSGALGAKRWFSETAAVAGSFVDPWSLAARQESAVLEQRTIAFRRNVDPTASSHTGVVPRAPLPSPVVGWPPVRAFRKNLVTPSHPHPEMDVKKDPKKTKSSEEGTPTKLDTKSTMFVKVNMEGCNVGRKIDLMAHNSYQSLSCALQKMFHNFLTVGYSNNTNPDAQVELTSANYILLYEDNEGDRLLVGDVPWEMFLGSVKRLYIANGSKDPKTAEERAVGNNKNKQFEVEVKANG